MQRADVGGSIADAEVGRAVERRGRGRSRSAISSRHGSSTVAPGGIGAEAIEVLLRQVHAAAVEVLGDVAEEVGELERVPEVAGGLAARPGSSGSRIGSIISPITAAEPSMYPSRSSHVA